MTGKGLISLKDISLDQDSIIPVEIFNKKIPRVSGIVYVKLAYTPSDPDIYEDDWIENMQIVS